MPKIEVTALGSTLFNVTVWANQTTEHRVTVSADYLEKLLIQEHPMENVILESFTFLLAREPNTSILRSFDLSVIERYFPEYPATIRKMLE